MKILIDADGCPVVDLAVRMAKKFGLACLLFCDTAHVFEKDGATTQIVSKGADSADFALVNRVSTGDIVVTQDYGLAAMCLAKNAVVVNQDGMEYTDGNMDALLLARHTAQKIRRSGGRLKGPPKRTAVQNERFAATLVRLLDRQPHVPDGER